MDTTLSQLIFVNCSMSQIKTMLGVLEAPTGRLVVEDIDIGRYLMKLSKENIEFKSNPFQRLVEMKKLKFSIERGFTGEVKNECPICNREFIKESGLHMHLRHKH